MMVMVSGESFKFQDNWWEKIEIIESIDYDDVIQGTKYYLTFFEMKDIILRTAQKYKIGMC